MRERSLARGESASGLRNRARVAEVDLAGKPKKNWLLVRKREKGSPMTFGDREDSGHRAPMDLALYPFLHRLNAGSRAQLLRDARSLSAPRGSVLLREGGQCDPVLLVSEGALRVYRAAEDGREISLYRVDPGELCVLALCAVLGHRPYAATACAAEDLKGYGVPASTFRSLFSSEEAVRAFVIEMFSKRLEEAMLLVSEVAFARMDQRLAKLLVAHAELGSSEGRSVRVTHQELAAELGTAREVVSRILRSFADQGLVTVSRGQIQLVDRQALASLIPGVH